MKKILSMILVLSFALALCPQAMAGWGDGWSDSWSDGWGSNSSGASYSVTGSTNLFYASSAQLSNINVAVSRLSSFDIAYGDHFSFNAAVGPRTAQYGFKNAVNGRGVVARGGGVGQVATTLYLAVTQLNGITYTEKTTWDDQFAQSYTSSGYDAVIVDYANGRDFSFLNEAGNLHVEMWASRSYLYCTISVSPASNNGYNGRLIGYSTIVLSGTNTLKNNVRRAADAINGARLSYYGEFSFNQLVGPRTQANGYGNAVNGRGVIVTGGGVAQVASGIYLAIKDLNSIYFLEKRTYDYRYNQTYVEDREDAIATDYNNGHDFRFRYTGYGTLLINTYVSTDGTRLITEIYEY